MLLLCPLLLTLSSGVWAAVHDSQTDVPTFYPSETALQQGDIIHLQGESEFYWMQLLSPSDFIRNRNNNAFRVPIPSPWNRYSIAGSRPESSGYATYRFRIIMPKKTPKGQYALRVPIEYSSYRLWVNEALLAENGVVANNRYNAQPSPLSQTLLLYNIKCKDTLDIVMQVSNYSYPLGGIRQPIEFGKYRSFLTQKRTLDTVTNIINGGLLFLCIWHLVLFFLNRRLMSSLWFALMNGLLILGVSSYIHPTLLDWFPGISWNMFHRIVYGSLLAAVACLLLYLHHAYPREINRKWIRIPVALTSIVVLIVLLAPPSLFARLGGVMMLLGCGVLLVLSAWRLPRAIMRKRRLAWPTLIAVSILTICFITEVILHYLGFPPNRIASPISIGVFSLMLTLASAGRLASSIKTYTATSSTYLHKLLDAKKELDRVNTEFNTQGNKLKQFRAEQKLHAWTDLGISELSSTLVKHKNNLHDLNQYAIEGIARYLNANVATIYIAKYNTSDLTWQLDLMAYIGLTETQVKRNASLAAGEGLVGACYTDCTFQHITDLPGNFITISSGLGELAPPALILAPLQGDAGAIGVMELGRFRQFDKYEISFIKRAANILANGIMHTKTNQDNLETIERLKAQNEQLGLHLEQCAARIDNLQRQLETPNPGSQQ